MKLMWPKDGQDSLNSQGKFVCCLCCTQTYTHILLKSNILILIDTVLTVLEMKNLYLLVRIKFFNLLYLYI
jgi:hypothetical protein